MPEEFIFATMYPYSQITSHRIEIFILTGKKLSQFLILVSHWKIALDINHFELKSQFVSESLLFRHSVLLDYTKSARYPLIISSFAFLYSWAHTEKEFPWQNISYQLPTSFFWHRECKVSFYAHLSAIKTGILRTW